MNKRATLYYILNAIILIIALLLFLCSCTKKVDALKEPEKKIKPKPAPDYNRHGETFEITKHKN